jgi:ribosomal protein S17E|tara:strand:- start:704 stop:844 length:141 start_codon:yes stop_codon:yes gene_type:complete
MKKKLKKIIEKYEKRLVDIELENMKILVSLANLESRLDNHDHNGDS